MCYLLQFLLGIYRYILCTIKAVSIVMTHLPIPPKGKHYDLNVPYNENQKHLELSIQTLKDLGYTVCAFSIYIKSNSTNKGGKRKKVQLPSAPDKQEYDGILQLSRATIELMEIDDQITVRDAASNGKFDLIAVEPKTEKLFLSACTQLHVDIISIDCTERPTFLFRSHQVRAAIARGIQFEFNYAPMIRDPTIRRYTTTAALRLMECCKSKNIILSSKALQPIEFRGPYDVANLGMLFSMTENLVPRVVSHNCRCAVVHSFVRKTAKGAIYAEKMEGDHDTVQKPDDDEESVSKRPRLDAGLLLTNTMQP